MLRPFADPRVGGVTPRQAIFDAGDNPVRRLADWIEDIRYHLTVPAQSVFGQVGCLAGRTIAYRRDGVRAGGRAARRARRVLGVPAARRRRPRAHERAAARRLAHGLPVDRASSRPTRPSDWRTFWRQQLRWGRSSQRETLLSLRWLWRRPVAFACFATDIVTPFALYARRRARRRATRLCGGGDPTGLPLALELAARATSGCCASIGVRQLGHVRRAPRDLARLPLFVLQLTFVMVPIRIAAFATMFHQGWTSRPSAAPALQGAAEPLPESARA